MKKPFIPFILKSRHIVCKIENLFKFQMILSILGAFCFDFNHRDEDPYIAFLNAFGRVERDIRNGVLTVEQLYERLKIDWGDEEIEEADEMFSQLEFGRLWFCREECGFWCHGPKWASERSNHQRSCEHWKKLPSMFDYRHMKSRCTCCVIPGGHVLNRKKPFGTKFKKCKGAKIEKRMRDLKKKALQKKRKQFVGKKRS